MQETRLPYTSEVSCLPQFDEMLGQKGCMMRAHYQKEGLLMVISGPSGAGKGTVCRVLRDRVPEFIYSISVTTRPRRIGEEDGVHYFFLSVPEFHQMVEQDGLIEWAEYVGNFYGTPRRFVEDTLAAGKDILLEIDVQGALQVKQRFAQAIFIFLLPPSTKHLHERIRERGTESETMISRRLSMANDEYQQIHYYDYVVINDEVEKACAKIEAIRIAEHCRKQRAILGE
jgi:guanylate kinase